MRMQAFTLLESIQVINPQIVENLKEAQSHHNWRLKKFAKAFAERHAEDMKYN